MRAADLEKARALLAERDALNRLAARLKAGEGLHLVLGQGSGASEIVLSPAYLAALAGEVSAALDARSGRIAEALAALGVEP